MTQPRVLAFDSGIGGLSVVEAMVAAGLPIDIDYAADFAWLPYGGRPDADLIDRVPRLLAALAGELSADLVVIACNTASTVALAATRERLRVPVVGVVPPIKPAAAASRTGVIGVLATPATIQRPYTHQLIADHAAGMTVIRVGSTALVAAGEAKLAGEVVDPAAVQAAIAGLFNAPGGDRLDVVALSCTHFSFLRPELEAAAPRAIGWVDSGPAIARRVRQVLSLGVGQTRLRRFAASDPARLLKLAPTLAGFGFQSGVEIAASAPFALRPAAQTGWG
ncbi:MAG: glutamate racemase [Caulobacterales bacterium]|jgi:glutamate racemase